MNWTIKIVAVSSLAIILSTSGLASWSKAKNKEQVSTGVDRVAEIIVGPFDLHRRYRSMEGPYVMQQFRLGDLLASPSVGLPESMVVFVEGNSGPGPSMSGQAAVNDPQATKKITGLVDTADKPRELYWFKGMKIDVLDENDKPLPTAEFICHLNLDVDPAFRDKVFPEGERCHNGRLITLTQGQTDIQFPEGFAVPVASDERWTLTFQAANRTTDQHRRLKHRCRMYFVKDADLLYPVKALGWYAPYISVIVDRDSPEAQALEHKGSPGCLGTTVGVTAPNSVPGALVTDSLKRRLSGHWVVPPGIHTYTTPIIEERDGGFTAKERTVHFAWSHIHPLCSSVSLNQCNEGAKKSILTVHAKTNVSKGLELEKIEIISSKEGIKVPAGAHYELTSTYNNVTDIAQDSMVVLGLFFADTDFVRPGWVLSDKNQAFCGVSSACSAAAQEQANKIQPVAMVQAPPPPVAQTGGYMPSYPLYDPAYDGALLTQSKIFEMNTTAGKLHLELNPALAPVHATQMYKLFKSGAYTGTPIFRYEPNFVLQVNSVETKVAGQRISAEADQILRRLPLEVDIQVKNGIVHQKWYLSMARYTDPNSAVSSFSIMLGNAPHLDKQYTLFGKLIADPVSVQTINNIIENWSKGPQPYILGLTEVQQPFATQDK
ncbi:MAG: peptidylprolyl isomerase [Candidatus Obscuribacterales bacterium]|nr:peptidylprolyl isomerase [Candidatus Obscuribacterales bacterium]